MGGAPFGVRRIEIFLIKTDLSGGKSCTPFFLEKFEEIVLVHTA